MFSVSEAAVSQYLHEKRGAEVDFTPELQKNIKEAATKINDKLSFVKETQQLLHKVWHTKFICKVCHQQNKEAIPKNCTVCFD